MPQLAQAQQQQRIEAREALVAQTLRSLPDPATISEDVATHLAHSAQALSQVPAELTPSSATGLMQVIDVAAQGLQLAVTSAPASASSSAPASTAAAATSSATSSALQAVVDTASHLLQTSAETREALSEAPVGVREVLHTVGQILAQQATSPNASTSAAGVSTARVQSDSLTISVSRFPARLTAEAGQAVRVALRGSTRIELALQGDIPAALASPSDPSAAEPPRRRLVAEDTVIFATEWARDAWLPGAAAAQRPPPMAPPPLPPPRQGCAGPSWLESPGGSLASSVTSVELMGLSSAVSGAPSVLLPVLLRVEASLPAARGGANCSRGVQCNRLGGNACVRGSCRCVGDWYGLNCETEARCRVWVGAKEDWAECSIDSNVAGLVHCRCDTLGEMAVRARDWVPNLAWIDVTEDWKLLGGLGAPLPPWHPLLVTCTAAPRGKRDPSARTASPRNCCRAVPTPRGSPCHTAPSCAPPPSPGATASTLSLIAPPPPPGASASALSLILVFFSLWLCMASLAARQDCVTLWSSDPPPAWVSMSHS